MIDKKRIEQEAEHFFAWPTDDRNYVTRTSMLIFTNTIAEMVRKEFEAEQLATLKADVQRLKDELNAYDKALRCEGWPYKARIDRARMLAEVNTQKPSAYIAFSENGEHISYWTRSLEDAQTWTGRTNKKCEPFYPAPVAPTYKDSLTVAPAPQCTCLGSQLGPHYCEVHSA